MSHGHAPFVILFVTLVRKRSLRPNTLTGAAFHISAMRISQTKFSQAPIVLRSSVEGHRRPYGNCRPSAGSRQSKRQRQSRRPCATAAGASRFV